ncbi:class I SAM-dependent methyltransferase [Fibrella sp. WM1]|uniref:class I SAM-dependent methyltransferase n=1 Tax=Fibrella musci TaxID=3242485 RepID=UPI0035208BA8
MDDINGNSCDNIYEPAYVKRLFNRMSGSYERMNFITSFGFSIRWRNQFIRRLPTDERPIRVIDLLSGLGENWALLLDRYPRATFTALDFSEEMHRVSSQKNEQQFNSRFTVLNQDILASDLSSGEFDVVVCAFGLKTFNGAQLEALAKTTSRILKPQGQFSFIEISKPPNKLLLWLYRFYLKRMIPLLGNVFLGNPSDYRMLWEYTDRFANAKAARAVFERYGLMVQLDDYFYGCATGISGRKHAADPA